MSRGPLSETARGIKDEVSVDLFARNLLMILFLVVSVGYLMMTQGNGKDLDLSFALGALIVAGVLVYLGSMAKLVLRGSLLGPLSESVYYLAPASVMAIVLAFGPSAFPAFLKTLAVPGLVLGSVLSVENIAHARRGPGRFVLRALALLAAAYLVFVLASGLGYPDLGGAVLLGAALAASISLLSLFREHNDPRLRAVGASLARISAFLLLTAATVTVTVYALFLRPYVMTGDGSAALMFEWLAVGVIILVVALLFRRALRAPTGEVPLTIEAMLQGAVMVKGDQTKVVEAVSEFVADGAKEKVLVMLIAALKDNGLDDAAVSQVVGKLVRYQEQEVSLAWTWAYGDLVVRRRRMRSRLIEETLEDAAARLGTTVDQPRSAEGSMEG